MTNLMKDTTNHRSNSGHHLLLSYCCNRTCFCTLLRQYSVRLSTARMYFQLTHNLVGLIVHN